MNNPNVDTDLSAGVTKFTAESDATIYIFGGR